MKRWIQILWNDRSRKFLITLSLTITALLLWMTVTSAAESQYTITGRVDVNQVDHYPLQQNLPTDRYRPTGNWVGRLILPSSSEASTADWVWIELYHTPEPARKLQG